MKEIKNNLFSIKIKNQGAELTSVYGYNHEYLWTSDKTFWNRHAPVLFPIVGSLIDKTYTYDNHEYQLNQHGFARDSEFDIYSEGGDYVTYSLKYNEETIKNYPFKFELRITYKLVADELTISYEVFNLDNKEIFYSIGAHPGFNIKDIKDYQLLIDGVYDIYTLDGAFIDQKIVNQTGNKNCSKEFFKNGAFIYVPHEDAKKTLTLEYKGQPYIKMDYNDFPMMGVWTPEHGNAPFICIEPWDGIADFKVRSTNEISKKNHIQKLGIKEIKKYSYKIKFYEEK
jgi:galactose mutarotase-like enzyme